MDEFIYQVDIPYPLNQEELKNLFGSVSESNEYYLMSFQYNYFEPLIKNNDVKENYVYSQNAAIYAFGGSEINRDHAAYSFMFKDKQLAEDCAKTFHSRVHYTVAHTIKHATERVNTILSQQYNTDSSYSYESELDSLSTVYGMLRSGASGNVDDAVKACNLLLSNKVQINFKT